MLTSVQISEEDHKFCKQNDLKFSDLMREAIFRKKEVLSGAVIDNVEEERRKRLKFQEVANDFARKNEELLIELERLKKQPGVHDTNYGI
jgi:hypothetical protein